MITVNEIMSEKVITLKASDTLSTARELMKEEYIRHIPIVDDNHFPVGIVTHRDILRALHSETNDNHTQSPDKGSILLEQIMSQRISYVRPDDPLRVAGLKLQKNKFGCLPVMNKDKLVGIITDSDFVDVAINLIEQAEQADNY